MFYKVTENTEKPVKYAGFYKTKNQLELCVQALSIAASPSSSGSSSHVTSGQA